MPSSLHRHRIRLFPILAVLLLALLVPDAALSQRRQRVTLDLLVVEDGSNQPVVGARVHVSGVPWFVVTDSLGLAQVRSVPSGQRMLTVERLGYAPVRAAIEFGSQRVEAEVALSPQAVELAAVQATAQRENTALRDRGFYDRKRTGMGFYMTRDDLARLRPYTALDIFRYVRGVRVDVTPQGKSILVSSRRTTLGGTCAPTVYLDGMIMTAGAGGMDPSDFVHAEQIEAIETYAGPASIPAEYNVTGSVCGVVLIWTRTGT